MKKITATLSSVAILFSAIILALMTVKNLGAIIAVLGGDSAATFSEIFSALSEASVKPHIIIPLVLSLLYAFLAHRLSGREKKRVFPLVIISLLCFLLCYLSCLLLSYVNSIRFIDVLISLVKNLGNGLADAL